MAHLAPGTNGAGTDASIRRILAPSTWPVAAVLLAGLAIRVVFFNVDGSAYDVGAFQEWTRQMLAHPLETFYAADLEVPQDHLPGDLWVLYALGRVWQWLGGGTFAGTGAAMYALKLVAIVFDLVLALIAAAIVRPWAGARTARMVMLAIVFNPGLIFISSIWTQWNVLATTLVAGAAYALVRWRAAGLLAGLPLLAAATLIKPQLLVLVLPVAVLVLRMWRGGVPFGTLVRNTVIGGAASVTLVLAAMLPFDVGFPGMGTRWTVLERVQFAADRYTTTTKGAYNFWTLFFPGAGTDDRATVIAGVTYQHLGFILFGMLCVLALLIGWRWRDERVGMLVAMAIIASATFMVITRGHERYLIDGMVLTIIASGIVPSLRPAAWVLASGLFLNVWFVWGFHHPGWVAHIEYFDGLYRALASINLIGFGLLLWGAWFRGMPVRTVVRPSPPTRNALHERTPGDGHD